MSWSGTAKIRAALAQIWHAQAEKTTYHPFLVLRHGVWHSGRSIEALMAVAHVGHLRQKVKVYPQAPARRST